MQSKVDAKRDQQSMKLPQPGTNHADRVPLVRGIGVLENGRWVSRCAARMQCCLTARHFHRR